LEPLQTSAQAETPNRSKRPMNSACTDFVFSFSPRVWSDTYEPLLAVR
jgi:hypothetical protein